MKYKWKLRMMRMPQLSITDASIWNQSSCHNVSLCQLWRENIPVCLSSGHSCTGECSEMEGCSNLRPTSLIIFRSYFVSSIEPSLALYHESLAHLQPSSLHYGSSINAETSDAPWQCFNSMKNTEHSFESPPITSQYRIAQLWRQYMAISQVSWKAPFMKICPMSSSHCEGIVW
jgi:hypothetical protein